MLNFFKGIGGWLTAIGSLLVAVFYYRGNVYKAKQELAERNRAAIQLQRDQIAKANKVAQEAHQEAVQTAQERIDDAKKSDTNHFNQW